jgi:hypothetical protein
MRLQACRPARWGSARICSYRERAAPNAFVAGSGAVAGHVSRTESWLGFSAVRRAGVDRIRAAEGKIDALDVLSVNGVTKDKHLLLWLAEADGWASVPPRTCHSAAPATMRSLVPSARSTRYCSTGRSSHPARYAGHAGAVPAERTLAAAVGVFRGTVVACFQRRVAAGGAAPPPGLGDLGGRPSFAGPGGQQHRHLATAPHGRRPRGHRLVRLPQ